MQRKPNLFIAGAPKCGTTSLYHYLAQHPDVFMPPVKEPRYFGEDLRAMRRITNLDDYLACFSGASHETWIGDASPYSLFSKTAAKEITVLSPEARVIVVLREPVSMIRSLYRHNVRQQTEPARSLAAAMRLVPDRVLGFESLDRAGKPCKSPALLYQEVARFSGQVERCLDVFGGDRVHVILFEDLAENALAVYRQICRYLQMDDSFTPEFGVHNQGGRVRIRALARFLRKPPRAALVLGKALAPRALRRGLHRLASRIAFDVSKESHQEEAIAPEFIPALDDDVQRLERLIGRDLSRWRGVLASCGSGAAPARQSA
jgi:hypothetical protein